jgi:16S rRNA (guanine(527)-N(7))-methyltransferase RsmG
VDPARIAELLNPFLSGGESVAASAGQGSAIPKPAFLAQPRLEQISTYIEVLLRWNSRVNLTAIRDPEEIVTRHFGESLFAARHLFPSPGPSASANASVSAPRHVPAHVLDVGSGAGFPGIPIKIWNSGIHLTLIESNHKKATFLREIIRSLTLTDADVLSRRAEDLLAQPNSASAQTCRGLHSDPPVHIKPCIVTLRAVERFNSILPVAAKLVAPAGRLALLIGGAQVPTALKILPWFNWRDPVLVPLSSNRVLWVGSPEH